MYFLHNPGSELGSGDLLENEKWFLVNMAPYCFEAAEGPRLRERKGR